jgi:hypothetical protein
MVSPRLPGRGHLPMLRKLATLSALLLLVSGAGYCHTLRAAPVELQHGDILFQSLPLNPVVSMIEGATNSPFSHCGIVHKTRRGWMVLEAIGPVRDTALSDWIKRGRDGHYQVYRLREAYRGKIPAILAAARKFKGLPYDIHYDFDDGKIYCSELIYKAFKQATGEELGIIVAVRDLNWQPYRATIMTIEKGPVPLDRLIITPRALSEAAQLERVARHSD